MIYDPEDMEALPPIDSLLGPAVVSEPLMPDSVRYMDCRKMYRVAQAYNQIIWTRWAKDNLPRWKLRPKWATDDECVLKVGYLVWLIDESVRRHESRMARVIEVIPGPDGVVR